LIDAKAESLKALVEIPIIMHKVEIKIYRTILWCIALKIIFYKTRKKYF